MKKPAGNPYRYGYADGLQGRECKNPFPFWHGMKYLSGYMDGQEAAKRSQKGGLYVTR